MIKFILHKVSKNILNKQDLSKNNLFLSINNNLVIVFDFLFIPFLNFPEKVILSFDFLVLHIEIISCKSQKVISELIL